MKKYFLVVSLLSAVFIVFGCNGSPKKADAQPGMNKSSSMPAAASQMGGSVLETMNSGGYTYVQIDTGSQKVWAAGPQMQVSVGDKVMLAPGMPMPNFHSKSLDRDFETIYFVPAIQKEGEQFPSSPMGMTPPGQPSSGGKPAVETVEIKKGSIKKAKGGKTVAEVFETKQDLAGKKVSLRGKVVKYTPQIMGKNWIHLQDGTGGSGTNDLTVTTAGTANNGDTVLVSGMIAVDKDFGYGYKYAVILEDAEVKVE